MKLWPYIVVLAVMVRSAVGICQEAPPAPPEPRVKLTTPYVGKVGEPFRIRVELEPAPDTPVEVQMETGDITYSQSRFRLGRGQHKVLTAKVVRTQVGLAWVGATAEGYGESFNAVNVGYRGRLKLNSTEKLPYESATTLSLLIVDSDGKPLATDSRQDMHVESSDATLSNAGTSGNTLRLSIPPGATISPQFQIKPKFRIGGNVHLNATLLLNDMSLSQESFELGAQPAWWLPLVLAIAGGLLHSVYKISRLPSSTFLGVAGILMASAVAGCVGYLFANFDLFGLKLDPNVLRTYPLIGFLFSYFGVEVLLSDKLSSPKPSTATTPPAPH